MKVKIYYFTHLHEKFSKSEEEQAFVDGAKASALLERLFPEQDERERMARVFRVAINEVVQPWNTPLKDGDVLALIAPLSGG